jgi:hypothetical protein
MLKVYNETARYCNQAGRRKGSVAVYLEPWHADVWEFVELRKNTGADTERCRDLFLALWVPDEFMKRLIADDDWFLMSPDVCPGLIDAYGEDFSALYNGYVAEKKYLRSVKARTLWQHVINCQVSFSVVWVMVADADVTITKLEFRDESYLCVTFLVAYKGLDKEFSSGAPTQSFLNKSDKDMLDAAWKFIEPMVASWMAYVEHKDMARVYEGTSYTPDARSSRPARPT